MDRRTFIATTLTAGAISTAGCIDDVNSFLNGDSEPGDPRNPGNNDPRDDPVDPELNLQDQEISIEWSPELADYDGVPGEHQIPVEAANIDSLDKFQLGLEKIVEAEADYEQDELLTSQIPLEQNEMQVPADQFFTGTQTLQLQQDGDTVDAAPVVKNIPQGYRVDVRNTDGEALSEWSTPYQFDTLVHRPKEIEENRLEHIRDTYLMDNFIQEVRNDADFNPRNKRVYPNWDQDAEGRDWDRGHFDLEEWKETETLDEMMKWMNPALQAKQFDAVEGAISTNVQYMASSAELATNELHPTLEIHGWGFFNAGAHGTMMFHDHTNEEWWHVDSTSDLGRYARKPENAQLHRGDVWSPFTAKDARQPGFHPGPVKDQLQLENPDGDELQFHMTYRGKSSNAQIALLATTMQPRSDPDRLFITDLWMDEAYEHIRNDGDFQTIHDPLQQLEQMQRETGGRQDGDIVGLYGSLEEPKIVSGEKDAMLPVYEDAITNPDILVDEEHIHDYLEDLGTTDYQLEAA